MKFEGSSIEKKCHELYDEVLQANRDIQEAFSPTFSFFSSDQENLKAAFKKYHNITMAIIKLTLHQPAEFDDPNYLRSYLSITTVKILTILQNYKTLAHERKLTSVEKTIDEKITSLMSSLTPLKSYKVVANNGGEGSASSSTDEFANKP